MPHKYNDISVFYFNVQTSILKFIVSVLLGMQIQFVSLYIVVISRPEDCKSDTSRLGVRKLAYLPLLVTVQIS